MLEVSILRHASQTLFAGVYKRSSIKESSPTINALTNVTFFMLGFPGTLSQSQHDQYNKASSDQAVGLGRPSSSTSEGKRRCGSAILLREKC